MKNSLLSSVHSTALMLLCCFIHPAKLSLRANIPPSFQFCLTTSDSWAQQWIDNSGLSSCRGPKNQQTNIYKRTRNNFPSNSLGRIINSPSQSHRSGRRSEWAIVMQKANKRAQRTSTSEALKRELRSPNIWIMERENFQMHEAITPTLTEFPARQRSDELWMKEKPLQLHRISEDFSSAPDLISNEISEKVCEPQTSKRI